MKNVQIIAFILAIIAGTTLAEPELLFENSDFETGTLKNWTAEGTSFHFQPTKGNNPGARNREASKHQGAYWIGTFEKFNGKAGKPGDIQTDRPTGQITSIPFKIEKKFIHFLVGAGAHKETSVRLLVDGKNYYLTSGRESETMVPVSADVSRFKGKDARIMLLDNHSGGWGHLNADYFTASDEPLPEVLQPVEASKVTITPPGQKGKKLTGPAQTADLKIEKRYLLFPIDNGAAKPSVHLSLDGKPVRFVTAELAADADATDWWAFEDLSEFKGKTLKLEVSGLAEDGFALIRLSDSIPGESEWGDERLRPQFHFSQKVGWNNDPNGMVYLDGEYHLYLQHNPYGWRWGNMTWAHAVSKDLVRWKQLPNVLHHRKGDAMFSGGAVVDWKNTGGWKTGDHDVIVASWTSTGRGECIAHSNDKGRTFTEYEGNPVVKHKGRDPKIVWYDPPGGGAGWWVMVIYNEDKEHGRNIVFYTSKDLKNWEKQMHLPGYFECAELFWLPVDGNPNRKKWVVFAADAKYAIGSFDGKRFKPEHEGKHQLHWGAYYASQLFSDAPDNRRIQIGWAKINLPGMSFNQTFSIPTELTLRTTDEGVRLFGEPVKEMANAHGKKHKAVNKPLAAGQPVSVKTAGALFDIRAEFEIGSAEKIGLDLDGRRAVTYDVKANKLNDLPLKPTDGKIFVQVLVDRPMIEIFGGRGRTVFTGPFQNDLNLESVGLISEGGDAKLISLEVNELAVSWKQPY